jgi:hypothetical protein
MSVSCATARRFSHAQPCTQVPYKRNVLAMFINSYTSIHAVSPRSVTPFSRRLVNVIGQKVRRPLARAIVPPA